MTTAAAALQRRPCVRPVRHTTRGIHSRRFGNGRHPIASASSTSPSSSSLSSSCSPVTSSSGRSADELARFLAGLFSLTRGGVDATPEDVMAAQHAADELEAVVDAAAEYGAVVSPGGIATLPITSVMLAGTKWRLVGCLQRTLPSPASWLGSPFFWVAKEAQHESYRLSQLPELFPPFKLAAKISAGNPPKTGEEWIAAFGRREVAAAFPFSIVESLLNGLQVPFESREATVEFGFGDYDDETAGGGGAGGVVADENVTTRQPLRMVSRVQVDFANGRVAGDIVTECFVAEEEDDVDATKTTGEGRGGGEEDEGMGGELTIAAAPAAATTSAATACLVSTRFENTDTPLDGIVVPSGKIMAALMSPSPNLRRQRGPGGYPGVRYRRVYAGRDVLVTRAGSCEATSTLLVYERA